MKANAPVLLVGELYFCTDTDELLVGTSGGNFASGIPVFNASGVRQLKPHIVVDTITMSASTATVTLTGGSVFSGSTSYVVTVTDNILKRTLSVVRNSGSSFTISGGASGDVVSYICIGT